MHTVYTRLLLFAQLHAAAVSPRRVLGIIYTFHSRARSLAQSRMIISDARPSGASRDGERNNKLACKKKEEYI